MKPFNSPQSTPVLYFIIIIRSISKRLKKNTQKIKNLVDRKKSTETSVRQ